MVPDPVKEESTVLSVTLDAINNSESDEDIDVDQNHRVAGYSQLPMEPPADNSESSDDESEASQVIPDSGSSTSMETNSSHFDKGTLDDALQVWAAPSGRDIEPMSPDHAEKIKEAMKGFHLPVSAIPPWAQEDNGDQWMNFLLERIQKN